MLWCYASRRRSSRPGAVSTVTGGMESKVDMRKPVVLIVVKIILVVLVLI